MAQWGRGRGAVPHFWQRVDRAEWIHNPRSGEQLRLWVAVFDILIVKMSVIRLGYRLWNLSLRGRSWDVSAIVKVRDVSIPLCAGTMLWSLEMRRQYH